MKLGTETGSVMNHIASRATRGQPDPVVGMGATELCWSDRHACTITSVTTTRMIVKKVPVQVMVVGVKRDIAKVVKGSTYDGTAEYEYSRDDRGDERYWALIEGRWTGVDRNVTAKGKVTFRRFKGNGLATGYRDEHYDPSF